MGVIKAGITQVDPSASTELTEKSGYLTKRPENVLRLTRRQWPKRYCTVSSNGFTMAHSHVSNECVYNGCVYNGCVTNVCSDS